MNTLIPSYTPSCDGVAVMELIKGQRIWICKSVFKEIKPKPKVGDFLGFVDYNWQIVDNGDNAIFLVQEIVTKGYKNIFYRILEKIRIKFLDGYNVIVVWEK